MMGAHPLAHALDQAEGGGDSGVNLVFSSAEDTTGVTPRHIGSVRLASGTLRTTSRALLGTQAPAGGTATLYLQRFSTGIPVPNATWAVTGNLADVTMALAATIPADDWYDIYLVGNVAGTTAIVRGLRLDM